MSPASDPHVFTGSHTQMCTPPRVLSITGCLVRIDRQRYFRLEYIQHRNIKDQLTEIICDRYNSAATTGTLNLKLSVIVGLISPM